MCPPYEVKSLGNFQSNPNGVNSHCFQGRADTLAPFPISRPSRTALMNQTYCSACVACLMSMAWDNHSQRNTRNYLSDQAETPEGVINKGTLAIGLGSLAGLMILRTRLFLLVLHYKCRYVTVIIQTTYLTPGRHSPGRRKQKGRRDPYAPEPAPLISESLRWRLVNFLDRIDIEREGPDGLHNQDHCSSWGESMRVKVAIFVFTELCILCAIMQAPS